MKKLFSIITLLLILANTQVGYTQNEPQQLRAWMTIEEYIDIRLGIDRRPRTAFESRMVQLYDELIRTLGFTRVEGRATADLLIRDFGRLRYDARTNTYSRRGFLFGGSEFEWSTMATFMDRVTVAQRLVTQEDIRRREPQLRREAQERAEQERARAEGQRREQERQRRREEIRQRFYCSDITPGWGRSLGVVSFYTDNEWTVEGNGVFQIWSDAVTATDCQKETFSFGDDQNIILGHHFYLADCRSNPGFPGDLFSWCAVVHFADVLCPYPWRVPTQQDFSDLNTVLEYYEHLRLDARRMIGYHQRQIDQIRRNSNHDQAFINRLEIQINQLQEEIARSQREKDQLRRLHQQRREQLERIINTGYRRIDNYQRQITSLQNQMKAEIRHKAEINRLQEIVLQHPYISRWGLAFGGRVYGNRHIREIREISSQGLSGFYWSVEEDGLHHGASISFSKSSRWGQEGVQPIQGSMNKASGLTLRCVRDR